MTIVDASEYFRLRQRRRQSEQPIYSLVFLKRVPADDFARFLRRHGYRVTHSLGSLVIEPETPSGGSAA